MSLPLLLLTLSFHIHVITISAASTCHVDDEAGLLGFKSAITSDPSGMLATWKSGTDCCTWPGVACRENNRVTELSLYGQSDQPNTTLSGSISPSLSRLRLLTGLYLVDLRLLTGPFPSAAFSLPSLSYIYIENSLLSGPLPADLNRLPNLAALSLAGNRFSGVIPPSVAVLTQLTQLTQLNLGNNHLSGKFPAGISRLRNLTMLHFDRNQLSGPIPNLSSLTNLRSLSLSYNRFSGVIPLTIAALGPKLAYLELGHNLLSGRIPDYLGNFTVLDTLDLSGNALSGPVPASFKKLTKIFNLDLSGNRLVDPFPEMEVKGIESLDLSHNRFNLRRIPRWVSSSPIIYSLKLAGCGIRMRFEDWKPSETYFYDYIDLSDNEISGSPAGLLNRTGFLVGFRASGNKLRFDMGRLGLPKSLKYLDLSRNEVFGKVPVSISGLKEVNVSYNHLCGRLPPTRFPAAAFRGNDCLCGSPLPPCRI